MAVPDSLIVYCADIGSQAKNAFAWARASGDAVEPEWKDGRDIPSLAEGIAGDLGEGWPVALGFECPLYVPLRRDPDELTSGRQGETVGFAAGPAASVMATGLVQAPTILEQIARHLGDAGRSKPEAFLGWNAFESHGSGLLLWEADVGSDSHGEDHVEDAKTGARVFLGALPDPSGTSRDPEWPVQSLAGAALLRTGWSEDTSLLATACLRLVAQDVVP